jgi:hypothetical protein
MKPSKPVSPDKRRAHRARPTPKWLSQQQDLDEMARRRTMMVLRVLSGELAVTDAISDAKISRGTYYQLETKALQAMLRALAPGAELSGTPGADGMVRRISELEAEVKQLLQEKRRAERLLFLTKKLVKRGPLASPLRGRPRKTSSSSSTKAGAGASTSSAMNNSTTTPAAVASTSSRDGASSP